MIIPEQLVSTLGHRWCSLTRRFRLFVSFPQQEVLSASFSRQTVRRAHGLRSAAHSTLFSQPPTALSPQVSICMHVCVRVCDGEIRLCERCRLIDVDCTWIRSFFLLIYWQQRASAVPALSDSFITILRVWKSFGKVNQDIDAITRPRFQVVLDQYWPTRYWQCMFNLRHSAWRSCQQQQESYFHF